MNKELLNHENFMAQEITVHLGEEWEPMRPKVRGLAQHGGGE